MVGVPLVPCASGTISRLFAGCGPLGAHADLLEHVGYAVADIEIVVHHKRSQAFQLFDLLRVFLHILQL